MLIKSIVLVLAHHNNPLTYHSGGGGRHVEVMGGVGVGGDAGGVG